MVANGSGYPAGFTPKPAPLGVSFGGTAGSEPRLLGWAYAFEQATAAPRASGALVEVNPERLIAVAHHCCAA
jgi:hypothetical protein